ncbi:MAG: hypothetical protein JW741_14555 [Sedimentisphaerales bacterium]|nr:hypothetical protein [Sedimentisphaerales bacterium]
MDHLKIGHIFATVAGLALLVGCAAKPQGQQATEPLVLAGATRADVMQATRETVSAMHFHIDKFDVESGVVHTKPLRGAQFFELWRNDNVGGFNAAEANLNTIRRFVELRIAERDSALHVDCSVWVQRLSLPENEVASVSQAYRMHSQSTPSVQRLELEREQKKGMAWVDLGRDARLEAEILKRIESKMKHQKEDNEA